MEDDALTKYGLHLLYVGHTDFEFQFRRDWALNIVICKLIIFWSISLFVYCYKNVLLKYIIIY